MNNRATLLLMGLFSLANIYPLWLVDYFPSVDGPAHVAITHIWMNLEDPNFDLYRDYYEIGSLSSPNMLIYVLLYGLMSVFPPFIAEKILLTILAVGLPWSVWYMTTSQNRAHGIVALLAFPVVYNYITYFGFYNFLFGALFFCITLGFWLRYKASPDRHQLHYFLLSLLLLAAYFTHISSIAFILLSVTILLASEIFQYQLGGKYRADKVSEKDKLALNRQALFFLLASLPAVFLSIFFNVKLFRL